MSRQITITRTELGLGSLNLNDPAAGYYVSDEWSSGGVMWQRWNASGSPWVAGDRVVGQRQIGVDEIFTIYVKASTPAGIKAKIQTLATALGQYRYTLTINWDGATYTYSANGAGEVKVKDDQVDPLLHQAGWIALQITIPRDPGVG